MWQRILNEPVLIAAIIRQIISLSAAFGFDLTTAQTAAIMLLIESISTLISRALVTPTSKG